MENAGLSKHFERQLLGAQQLVCARVPVKAEFPVTVGGILHKGKGGIGRSVQHQARAVDPDFFNGGFQQTAEDILPHLPDKSGVPP